MIDVAIERMTFAALTKNQERLLEIWALVAQGETARSVSFETTVPCVRDFVELRQPPEDASGIVEDTVTKDGLLAFFEACVDNDRRRLVKIQDDPAGSQVLVMPEKKK